jgi:putative thioredoxin
VKLFRDGKLASEFTGSLPEPMVREFLSRCLPSAADKRVMEAIKLEEEGKEAEAKAIYQSVLASEAQHAKALIGLGRVTMQQGDSTGALEILERVSLAADERAEADRLIARLKLQSGGTQNETELRTTLNSDPGNLDVRFKLAQALAASERYDEALAEFLTIVKTDRQFQDDGARLAMVQIFEVLGSDHPLTEKYRSELAKVLFS